MRLIVVSNLEQLKWLESQPKFDVVLCDNARFYSILRQKSIPFVPLDEFLIEEDWSSINEWGCVAALQWIEHARTEKAFESLGVNLPAVLYHGFSRALVQMVKNYRYAALILKRYKPDFVQIFLSHRSKTYTNFSGNLMLNYFLGKIAEVNNLKLQVEKLNDYGGLENLPENQMHGSRKGYMKLFKKIFEAAYGILFPLRQGKFNSFIFFGSLKHLSLTALKLSQVEKDMIYFDHEFQLRSFRFAKKNGMRYIIPACLPCDEKDDHDWIERAHRAIFVSLDRLSQTHAFSYRDEFDFSDFIKSYFFTDFSSNLIKIHRQKKWAQSLVQLTQCRGAVVHENYSSNGGVFAAVFTEAEIPVFCLSHANLSVDFEVPPQWQKFQLGYTLVQSEYEKRNHVARGWSPDYIFVTGIPRYDHLFSLANNRCEVKQNLPYLYCATGLWQHTPDQRGFLGSKVKLFGGVQVPSFKIVLESFSGSHRHLLIKPHSLPQVPVYKKFLGESSVGASVSTAPFDSNIFDLYQKSSAMIVCYGSTAMYEAAMIGLPVIFVDSAPPYSKELYTYAESGFCKIAKNKSELISIMEDLEKNPDRFYSNVTPESKQYYLGNIDGKAVERVVQFLYLYGRKANIGGKR